MVFEGVPPVAGEKLQRAGEGCDSDPNPVSSVARELADLVVKDVQKSGLLPKK